jgi:hypothetical protein
MTLRPLLLVVFAVGLSAIVLPAESSAQTSDWTFCAYEGEWCNFSGTQQVRYGANGLYTYQTLSGGAACTNSVFGDPAPGLTKQCDTIGTSSWSLCAYEGQTCSVAGTQQVRYGANGLYAYRTVTGSTACTNSVFGDPAPGQTKQCDAGGAATSSWSLCAYEGGVCAFSGTQQVRYGANGLYTYQTLSGGTTCNNSVFGDPAPGLTKQCHTSGSSTSPGTSPVTSLPGTVVFTPSSNHATAVDSYVLDVFPVGADPYAAYPVGTHFLGKPPISNGEIRADISSTIQALAPGTYIATVTAVGIGGSARSAPSPQFSR